MSIKHSKINAPLSFDEINKEVSFTVPGKPFGKQRPRMSRRGKFVTTYTPKETVEYENLVKLSYYNSAEDTKLKGAIKAKIKGVFPIPSSVSNKQKEKMISGEIKYTKKIDCDNMAKCILDALNNIAYDDDSQVYELSVTKEYGENPRVEITLKEDNF
jgi:Holliday junction resolvase RusA-like endonuclease